MDGNVIAGRIDRLIFTDIEQVVELAAQQVEQFLVTVGLMRKIRFEIAQQLAESRQVDRQLDAFSARKVKRRMDQIKHKFFLLGSHIDFNLIFYWD